MNMIKNHQKNSSESNSIFDSLISQAKKGIVFFDWYQMEECRDGISRNVDVMIQRI